MSRGRGRSRIATRGESSVAISLKGVRPIISEVREGISPTPLLATGFSGTGVIVEFNARVVLDIGWDEDLRWVKSDNTVKTGSS